MFLPEVREFIIDGLLSFESIKLKGAGEGKERKKKC
jgi:hypothetical protein